MTILRMSNACWLPKATDMNLDYGVLLLSPATMAARTLLNGTLYLQCLSFLHLIVFLSELSSCHVLSIIYTNFCFSQKKMILSPPVSDSNFLSQIQTYSFPKIPYWGEGWRWFQIFCWYFGGVLRLYVEGVYSQMGLKAALLVLLFTVIILAV